MTTQQPNTPHQSGTESTPPASDTPMIPATAAVAPPLCETSDELDEGVLLAAAWFFGFGR